MEINKSLIIPLKEEGIEVLEILANFLEHLKNDTELLVVIDSIEDKTYEIIENSELDIFPYSPIPSNKDSYAVVFKIFNPKKSSMFQFHSFGLYSGGTSALSYLGSWTIVIGK